MLETNQSDSACSTLSPSYIFNKAKWDLKGRWHEQEHVILKYPDWIYYYAVDIVGGRWPEGEHILKFEPYWALHYARDVIGGRWPEAEISIVQTHVVDHYAQYFPEAKVDWAANGWIDWLDS